MGGDETGEYSNGRSKRRWYDSTGVVWALIGSIAFMFASWGAVVYAKATSAEIKNAEQDVKIQYLIDDSRETQRKLDQILNRLK